MDKISIMVDGGHVCAGCGDSIRESRPDDEDPEESDGKENRGSQSANTPPRCGVPFAGWCP